jgi:cyclopropane fatty-acyl-phospholipid synthase-like methyltransferase
VSQETVPVPVPEDVGRLYDEYAALCDVTVGENLHFGYWDTADSAATLAEAAHRLTDVLADRLRVTAGQRLLDVGCGVRGDRGIRRPRAVSTCQCAGSAVPR